MSSTYRLRTGAIRRAGQGCLAERHQPVSRQRAFQIQRPWLNASTSMPARRPPAAGRAEIPPVGGSIAARIIKDSLFFFFSYEGLRNNTSRSRTAFVETPQFRQLIRSSRPNSLPQGFLYARRRAARRQRNLGFVRDAVQPGTPCRQVSGGLDLGSPTGQLGSRIGFDRAGGGWITFPMCTRMLAIPAVCAAISSTTDSITTGALKICSR